MKDIAISVLLTNNKPMHYRDISKNMIVNNLFISKGKTPEATLASQIGAEIRLAGDKSRFVKVKSGIFGLNTNIYPTFNQLKPIYKITETLPTTYISSPSKRSFFSSAKELINRVSQYISVFWN